MLVGLSIMQSVYLFRVRPLRLGCWPQWAVTLAFGVSFFALLVYVAITFRSVFQLVSFERVYDTRSAMVSLVAESGTRLGLYAQSWLAGVFLPVVFAIGLFERKYMLRLIAVGGYVFLFGVSGNKTTAVALVALPLLYLWTRKERSHASATFAWGVTAILWLGVLAVGSRVESLATWTVAVVNVRTFAIPPLLIVQYFDFFSTHPMTNLSHVTGLNALIRYPYEKDVGRTVADAYYSEPSQANAGMWAGDGLAAFGLPGIVAISIVCAALFLLVDAVACKSEVKRAVVSLGFIAITFANTSLFTTFVTGGLAIWLLTLGVSPLGVPAIATRTRLVGNRTRGTGEST